MKAHYLSIVLFAIARILPAQTATSVASGNAQSPTTWDCNCVPTTTTSLVIGHAVTLGVYRAYANVTINSGGSFIKQGIGGLLINGDLTINDGGGMTNTRPMEVKGNYHIAGIHDGDKDIDLSGPNKILSGEITGEITNPATLTITGNKTIPADAVVRKSTGQVRLDGTTVTNNGTFDGVDFGETGIDGLWLQGANSTLKVRGTFANQLALNASASGNTVEFNETGSNQPLKKTVGLVYHHVKMKSNGTAYKKNMRANMIINGDLYFTSCTFDSRNALVDHDVHLEGEWTNDNAIFLPRSNEVFFENTVPVRILHAGTEDFNIIHFNGGDTVALDAPIDVVRDLYINGTLDVGSPAQDISVGRHWTNNGTFIRRDGEVLFNGAGVQYQGGGRSEFHDLTVNKGGGRLEVIGGRQKVYNRLQVVGVEYRVNDSLSMASNAGGDSRIAPLGAGASITGGVYIQRYIDQGATNWRFLSAPAQGVDIAQWQSSFVTSGFPGSNWPTFPFTSIYSYDESAAGTVDDGFVEATGTAQPINGGQGMWVWCGDSLEGTDPFMVDIRGPIYAGNIDLPVIHTSYGTPSEDGWNMVGNPYVSAIDWLSPNWTKTNIDNAIYIWNPDAQNFCGYVGGLGVNGGSQFIASSQAFWVHANGASPLLRITENCKTATPAQFKSNDEEPQDIMRMRISGNNATDEAVLRIDASATNDFDGDFDAYEKWSLNPASPNICTKLADGKNAMVNTIPAFGTDTIFPLKVKVGEEADYTIEFTHVGGSFSHRCLVLVDLQENTSTPITTGTSYTFHMVPSFNGVRFQLRGGAEMTVDVSSASCSYTYDGSAIAHAVGTGPWTYNWLNDEGENIQSHTSDQPDTLANAQGGLYLLTVDGQGECAQLHMDVAVPAPPAIVTEGTVQDAPCDASAAGAIDMSITGGTAPYSVVWSTGTIGEDAGGLPPGTYYADVNDSHGCATTAEFQVMQQALPEASFTSPAVAEAGISVSFTNTSSTLEGTLWNFGDGGTSTEFSASHTYAVAGNYTVTLSVGSVPCVDQATASIEVGAASTGVVASTSAAFNLITRDDGVYLVVSGDASRDLSINADNLLGQCVLSNVRGHFAPGQHLVAHLAGTRAALLFTVQDNTTGERRVTKLVR